MTILEKNKAINCICYCGAPAIWYPLDRVIECTNRNIHGAGLHFGKTPRKKRYLWNNPKYTRTEIEKYFPIWARQINKPNFNKKKLTFDNAQIILGY